MVKTDTIIDIIANNLNTYSKDLPWRVKKGLSRIYFALDSQSRRRPSFNLWLASLPVDKSREIAELSINATAMGELAIISKYRKIKRKTVIG
jgi:hypothetical protein